MKRKGKKKRKRKSKQQWEKRKITDENQNEKRIAYPKQNEAILRSIVVYYGTNQGGDMESNKGCPNIKSKNSPYIFFNQRFVQQTPLLGIESVKKLCLRNGLTIQME